MPRQKKQRNEEIQKVFDNLQWCGYEDLQQVITKAQALLEKKKEQRKQDLQEEIKRMQEELEALN